MSLEPWQFEEREAAREQFELNCERRARFGEVILRPAETEARESGPAESESKPDADPEADPEADSEPKQTATGRRILAWRDDPTRSASFRGEPNRQANIAGVGWCRYEWRLASVLVGGRWEAVA